MDLFAGVANTLFSPRPQEEVHACLFADQLLCDLEISLMLAGWPSLVQQAIPSIVIDPWYKTERQSSLRRCMHGGTTLWSSTSRNIAYITSTILTDPYGAKDKIVKVGIIES